MEISVEPALLDTPKGDAGQEAGLSGEERKPVKRLQPLASPTGTGGSVEAGHTPPDPSIDPETPHPVRAQAMELALNRAVTTGEFQTPPPTQAAAKVTDVTPPEPSAPDHESDAVMEEADPSTLPDPEGPSAEVIAAKREARKRYARFKRSIESTAAALDCS